MGKSCLLHQFTEKKCECKTFPLSSLIFFSVFFFRFPLLRSSYARLLPPHTRVTHAHTCGVRLQCCTAASGQRRKPKFKQRRKRREEKQRAHCSPCLSAAPPSLLVPPARSRAGAHPTPATSPLAVMADCPHTIGVEFGTRVIEVRVPLPIPPPRFVFISRVALRLSRKCHVIRCRRFHRMCIPHPLPRRRCAARRSSCRSGTRRARSPSDPSRARTTAARPARCSCTTSRGVRHSTT